MNKRNIWMIHNVVVDMDEVVAIYKDDFDIVHIYLKNGVEIKSNEIDYSNLLDDIKLFNSTKWSIYG